MWLFVLTAIGSVPINIFLIRYIIDLEFFETRFSVLGVVTSVEIYLLLLGIEEIIIGVFGRMIWKRPKTMDKVV